MTIPTPVEKNIEAVHSARQVSDDRRRIDQKIVMFFARFFGTTLALYLHLLIFGLWSYFALFQLHGDLMRAHVDVVSLLLSGEAIFLAIFVLINQRHTDQVERKNADLHLQMSLVAEQKITQVARLLDLVSERIGVEKNSRKEMSSAKIDSEPTEILKQLEDVQANQPTTTGES